jgi:threonine dehydrogenase-like Zn-dependent dehydrogenase
LICKIWAKLTKPSAIIRLDYISDWAFNQASIKMSNIILERESLDPAKLITHRFKLKDVIKAYDTFENAARKKTLKVILTNE